MKPIRVGDQKEWLKGASGALIIILTFVLNGFLSFMKVGFNFSKLGTIEYWADFLLLFASELAVLFGMYILQRIKDLKKEPIIKLQKHIDSQREIVYGVDKVSEAEDWLREIYNYRERLFLFENKIKKLYERLLIVEPKKEDKHYNWKIKKYNKLIDRRDFLRKQIEFIKKDKERIKQTILASKNGSKTEEIEILEKELDTQEYAFKSAKIKYETVFWGTLLSNSEESSKSKNDSPYFHEKKELGKNILVYLATGMLSSSLISALIFPAFQGWSWNTFLTLIIRLIMLIFFMARGIGLSNKMILGVYFKALEKRKGIYNQMLCDLGISKIVINNDNE